MRQLTLLQVLLAVMLCMLVSNARAEPRTLAGRWMATPLRSDWVIGDWGQACGPTPNGGGAAGGNVTVATSGNELHMSGGGRDYSTSECWEQFPGLTRVSHSASVRAWQNTCKTKQGDARQATIMTTISATDTLIWFDETGQYQFVITGQNCTASVRRTRSLSLVQRDGEPAPAASTSAAAPATTTATATATATEPGTATSAKGEPGRSTGKVCREPGPPVRLEVRPARKLLRPGESFEFHTAVLDAAGCTLALIPVWKVLGEQPALELFGPGKVRIRDGAAESTVELQATLVGRSARVVVEVASQERYDALLAQSGLNAQGESSDAAVTRIATTAIGGASVVTRDESQRRRILFVGIVGGCALLLGLLGFALVQHSRRKPLAPEPRTTPLRAEPALTPTEVPPLGKVCPTCREEYPAEAAFCPDDGNRLVALRGNAEPSGPTGGVCPVCGQGYDPGVLTCPKHSEELLPAAMQAVTRTDKVQITKKICPVCGKQYSGDSQFCGSCGAALVPVN